MQSNNVVVDHVSIDRSNALLDCERSELVCVKSEDNCHRYEVDHGERDETDVDSLLEALLEEDNHVDTVGGEADDEEDGNDDGGHDSVKE